MCAALTVPIIKDGYRLYPGMPVGGRGAPGTRTESRAGSQRVSKGQQNSQPSLFASRGRMSSTESASASGSPPQHAQAATVTGVHGSPHHQILFQPRARTTSNQSQISARSSFEVSPPSARPDIVRGRSALSTSQLYMQQRRERAIRQQQKQLEMVKKQQQQQQKQQGTKNRKSSSTNQPGSSNQSDSNGNESVVTDYDAEDFGDSHRHRLQRSTSGGDPNNNKESGSNPFRKLLRRLGFGGGHGDHRDEVSAFSDSAIEPALPALQCDIPKHEMGVVVSAGH